MQFQDYYTTLGVSRTASDDEIKRAYRKLAKEWHPDRHPAGKREEVEKKFKAIAEANEVLSDPEKRKRYDALGEHWRHGQEFGGGGPGGPGGAGGFRNVDPEEFARMFGGRAGGGGGGGGFSDFFAQMFGDMFAGRGQRARPQPRPQRGPDAEAEIELSVGEALLGGKRSFALATRVPCEVCGGEGRLPSGTCPACAGLGAENRRKNIELKIPDDAHDGQVLRLRGLGQAGPAGPGDLLLTLRLVGDDTWRLRGEDVEADVVIAPWDLLEDCKVGVAVRGGTATAKIPAGTRPGQKLRLRGQGLTRTDGTRSDLLLVVRLGLPDELSDRQKELLRELAQASPAVRGGAATGS